ncbi:MAG: hypothetical protein EA385_07185 [Salinarimonadaceae bacterium]|nr:MAG: hypothetical protein EA385_07185 [Salinarimonadaceae bacterium]
MQNYKWDAVFACSGDWINGELKKAAKQFPSSFSYEDDAIKATGDFAAWSLVAGGSDQFIQFETPIAKGSVIDKASGATYPLDGAVPLVQFQLAFVQPESDPKARQLKFNCKVVGKKPGDKTPGAVTVLNADASGKAKIPALILDLLQTALAEAFIASQKQLSFVFAHLSLVPPPGASWLTLKKLAYTYLQTEDDVLGSLAVLGMFDDVDISKQNRVFDSALLRKGDQFGFVLAGSRFFQHILLPAMPGAYRGSSASQFYWTGGTSIINKGNVTLDKVKVGAIWYPPVISSLNVSLVGSQIRTIAAGTCDITGLADAYISFSVTSQNESSYNAASRTISFLPDPHKSITHSAHIPWWEKVIGVFTAGIMNVVIEAVSLAIEDAVSGAVGHTGVSSAGMGAQLVTWPGQSAVTPTDGGLEENFYFRGSL